MSMGRETEAEPRRSTQAEDATGTVLEELPNLLFRVRLDGGHVVGAAGDRAACVGLLATALRVTGYGCAAPHGMRRVPGF